MSQFYLPRGGLSTILLSVLSISDKYGFEILNEIKTITNNELEIKQPTLYSTLARLEKQGYITSYWRDGEIGGKRHYYHITDLGKKQLKESNFCFTSGIFEQKSPKNLDSIALNQKYDEIGDFDKKYEPIFIDNGQNSENRVEIAGTNQNEEKVEDAILITDKISPEDLPKVKKIEDVKNLPADEKFAEKLNTNFENNDIEKINQLYSKTFNNQSNKYDEINYKQLKERYDEMNIDFYENSMQQNKSEILTNFGHKIPSNKLFCKYFTLFLLVIIETVAVALCFYFLNGKLDYFYAYIIIPIIFSFPALYFMFNRKSFKQFNKNTNILFLNILIVIIGIILFYSINMLLGMNFNTITNYPTTFIYPCILLLNLIIAGIFDVNFSKKYY